MSSADSMGCYHRKLRRVAGDLADLNDHRISAVPKRRNLQIHLRQAGIKRRQARIANLGRNAAEAGPGGIPYGTCALIWCADTYSMGAGTPLIVSATSASESGSGPPGADAVSGASPDPNSVISAPGAIAPAE